MNALIDKPIPDTGLGIDAAHRVFDMACAGAKVAEVAAALEKARTLLGEYTALATIVQYGDSKQALASFFRQLRRYHDGCKWSPPHSARSHVAATTVASASHAIPSPPAPAERQEAAHSITEIGGRVLLPAQQEKVLITLRAIDALSDKHLTRNQLSQLGIPPQTVDKDSKARQKGDRLGGGPGLPRVLYRRAYVREFVAKRWQPKV